MDNLVNELNYDFNYCLLYCKEAITALKPNEQTIALSWVNKLTSCSSSIEESKLRNDFIFFLWKMCETGSLQKPFDERPPNGKLFTLKHLMPTKSDQPASSAHDKSSTHKKMPEILERSPDKGAFLISQPVPRCGAFCYLAVVSRPPE